MDVTEMRYKRRGTKFYSRFQAVERSSLCQDAVIAVPNIVDF